MPDFLHTLLLRCDQHDEVIVTAEEILQWPADQFQECVTTGLLADGPPARELVCRQCAEQPAERIVHLRGPDDQTHAYLPCPHCGPMLIEPQRLRRWRLNVVKLWERLFAGVDMKGDVREVVPRRIWRMGTLRCAGSAWYAMVGRGLWRPDGPDVLRRAERSSRTVLFVPYHLPRVDETGSATRPTIALRDIVVWPAGTAVLDMPQVEAALVAVDRTKPMPVKRPSRKRADRAATIEVLVRLMKAHILAARDFARATAERGMPELLPRPTQRDLARQAGIVEVAVSRCLRDSAARELRLLWKTAANLDELLRLSPAISGANS